MKNTEFLSPKNLAIAAALMDNDALTEAVSVEQAMKNGSELYDVSVAFAPFRAFVDLMYPIR